MATEVAADGAPPRVFLRPIASPFALGLLGLAGASLTAASLQLGWIPAAERHQAALIMLIAAPIPQLVASIFGFLARDPVVATGMGWLSAVWFSYALVLLVTPIGATTAVLGAFLIVAGTGIAMSAVEASSAKLVPALVFGSTALRFLLAGIWELSHSGGWQTADGACGVLVTVLALYAAFALALEDQRHRAVLPTGRRGRGAQAFEPGLAASDLAREAGVRPQL